MDARRRPIREQHLLPGHTLYCVYSKSLEDDHGTDRVRRCRLLTLFQEGLEVKHGRDRVRQYHILMPYQKSPTKNCSFNENFVFQNSAKTGLQ